MNIQLPHTAAACGDESCKAVLQRELQALAATLPLQQGMSQGSYPLLDDVQVMVLSVHGQAPRIEARVGVFFKAIIAGCSCADDPTPLDEVNEYCEFRLDIDTATARATLRLADND